MKLLVHPMILVASCSPIARAEETSFGCLRYEMDIVATLECGIGGDLQPWGLSNDGTVAGGVACGLDPDIVWRWTAPISGSRSARGRGFEVECGESVAPPNACA